MLCRPTSTFTIPSIQDDTDLECRLYHPPKPAIENESKIKKGAIIAHPYAPLGGCMDDPVIHLIGECILKQGYILGLFNFRGAGASQGRTSWSGKPEQADYISFLGFFIIYLNSLDTSVGIASPSTSPIGDRMIITVQGVSASEEIQPIELLLGGYSYGSLMTTQLPNIETLLSPFSKAAKGSAAAEIRLRASHLSLERNKKTVRPQRRGRSLTVEDGAFGGEECEPGTRRTSRESRRSMDFVRKSVEASRVRLHLRKHSSDDTPRLPISDETLETLEVPRPQLSFLLVSPVLPPVSSFLTMFSKPWKPQGLTSTTMKTDGALYEHLQQNLTLAVFGSKDFFTTSKKLQRWARSLADGANSQFTYHEVQGAGHFWQEDGAEARLTTSITGWLQRMQRQQD